MKETKITQEKIAEVLKDEFKKANVSVSDKVLKKATDFSAMTSQ
ncbi:hypothetical protein [Neobacillus niacini]|nr:hypothetical protein [Neobacillus niacini]MDR6997819.1 hypothetical protein [Neobacillus niacini]